MLLTQGQTHFVRRLGYIAVGIAIAIYLIPYVIDTSAQAPMYREFAAFLVSFVLLVLAFIVDCMQLQQKDEEVDLEERLRVPGRGRKGE